MEICRRIRLQEWVGLGAEIKVQYVRSVYNWKDWLLICTMMDVLFVRCQALVFEPPCLAEAATNTCAFCWRPER